MNKFSIIAITLIASVSGMVHAADCNNFKSVGSDITRLADGIVMYTASATVDFDDIESLNDARLEAELEAKAGFAKFLQEELGSDTKINQVIQKSSSQSSSNPQAKTASVERTKITLKQLHSHAQALMRGVVVLGDCYTPGREVRVTVGFKPETLQAATNIQDAINASMQAAPGMPPAATPKNTEQPPETPFLGGSMSTQRVPGFSNRSQIDNF